MSLLIPDNKVLLQFVPNVLKSVQGETLLFDKIAPHLEVAEAWLTTTLLSEAVLAELPTRDANNKLFVALSAPNRAIGQMGRDPICTALQACLEAHLRNRTVYATGRRRSSHTILHRGRELPP